MRGVMVRLYIPKYPNEPVQTLQKRLQRHFGGYTLGAFGVGVWVDPFESIKYEEPVYTFDVAIESKDVDVLDWMLLEYKQEAAQKCVFYTIGDKPVFI